MDLITQAPTGTTMLLRALARYPDRPAFVWDDGRLTYRATLDLICLLYTSPSPRDRQKSRMPSSA